MLLALVLHCLPCSQRGVLRLRPQIQDLKNELGRLYANGVDVSPQVLSTYGIAAVSHVTVSIAQQPASAALRAVATTSTVSSSELNALKRT